MSDYIINKKRCTEAELDSISREDFCLRYIQNEKPLKLYKYFPNTIKDNRNYSIEALENNTAHLQNPLEFDDPYDSTLYIEYNAFLLERIVYYANLCKIKINPKWDYFKILNELAECFCNHLNSGKNLESLFLNEFDINNSVHLRHQQFLLILQQNLVEYSELNNVRQLISEALHNEFIKAKEFIKRFRVCCFTTSPYSMLMWSHYANLHKGFCIEYEIPNYSNENAHLFHNLYPVIYSEQRKSVLPYCLNALTNKDVTDYALWGMYKYGLLTKSMDWKYQDEWRLVSYDTMLSQDEEYNCRFFDIKKVYLGSKMDKAERLKIIKSCKDKIPCVGVMPDPNKFEMVDCPNKCEKCKRVID